MPNWFTAPTYGALIGPAPVMRKTYSASNLTNNQKALVDALKESFQKVIDLDLLLVANSDGNPRGDNLTGRVMQVLWQEGTPIEEAMLKLIFPEYGVHDVYLWRLELKDPRDLDLSIEERKNRKISRVIEVVNASLKKDFTGVVNKIQKNKTEVNMMKESIEKKSEDIKNLEAIEKKGLPIMTIDSLKKEIENLKQHEEVEDAYLSTSGNIVVLTKALYAISPRTNKVKRSNLGRYVINLNLDEHPSATISNRDYLYSDGSYTLYHPHVTKSKICWGSHEREVRDMLNAIQIFQFVDFAITFLSIFPQDDGDPYVDYSDWLRGRNKTNGDVYIEPKL